MDNFRSKSSELPFRSSYRSAYSSWRIQSVRCTSIASVYFPEGCDYYLDMTAWGYIFNEEERCVQFRLYTSFSRYAIMLIIVAILDIACVVKVRHVQVNRDLNISLEVNCRNRALLLRQMRNPQWSIAYFIRHRLRLFEIHWNRFRRVLKRRFSLPISCQHSSFFHACPMINGHNSFLPPSFGWLPWALMGKDIFATFFWLKFKRV